MRIVTDINILLSINTNWYLQFLFYYPDAYNFISINLGIQVYL